MSGYVDTIQDRDGTDYHLKATIPSVQSTASSVAATDPVSVSATVDSDGVVSFDFAIPQASTANADAAAQEARDAASACESATSAANTAASGATTAAQNAINATVNTVNATQDARSAITDTEAATSAANSAATAANTAKEATIAATTAANSAATSATDAASSATAAAASANSAASSATNAASAANTAKDNADAATERATDAAVRAETAARPTEEMFASVHELLRAGSADAVTGSGDVVSATFLQRASNVEGARDGVATIECIRGNTVGWNQLVALGDDTGTKEGINYVLDADGTITVNGTCTASTYTVIQTGTPIPLIDSHKYLYTGCPAGGTDNTYHLSNAYTTSANYRDTGSGVIFTPNSTLDTGKFMVRVVIYSGVTVSNLVFRPQLFDLTQIFGAGNEPATVEEFEALYPEAYYPYNAGTLKPVNMTGVETVGFNQWDDSVTLDSGKAWRVANGQKGTTEGYFCSSDQFEVFPNTEYTASFTSTAGAVYSACFYNADHVFIGSVSCTRTSNGNRRIGTFTTPANCRYVGINFGGSPVNPTDPCFHLSQDGTRNGEYEPHWEQTREIDLATYFPTGLKAAGTAADALYRDHADTVIGSVDLGTLTWGYGSDEYFYSNELSDKAAGNFNIKCSKYAVSETVAAATMADKRIKGNASTNGLYVKDYAYTDPAEFKTAMSGVILYYEKATPTVTPIDPPLNLSYRVDTFGTETVVVEDGVISAPPVLDIAYGYDAESLRSSALSVVAPVENHRAGANYAVGSYLVSNGVLYRVTQAIASGEQITPGTNVTATTVMAEVAALNS